MEKQFISTQKYIIVSPKKVRDVVALVKKLSPMNAIKKLEFLRKSSSETIIKVIKTAIAQAKVQGVGEDELIFKEIQIGEGPRLKRGRAASRGRWHPYKKRMSHIRIVLQTTNSKFKALDSNKNQKSKTIKSRKEVES